MSKVLLIHGYATWREGSFFFRSEGEDGGFWGFRELVKKKEVAVFRWGVRKRFSILETFNLFAHFGLYFQEKRLSEDKKILERLHDDLTREQPTTIMCHSMGCYVLSNYLEFFALPVSVRNIIFIQADLPHDVESIRNRLENLSTSNVKRIINYYCPWDYTLIVGGIINGYLPAGLVGLKTKVTKNVFYPLHESWFVHNSSIRSTKFAEEIIAKYCE